MDQTDGFQKDPITPQMTLIDIIYRWRSTERVFVAYEEQAGVCLRCQALFDTLASTAEKYGLDLNRLLADLNALTRIYDCEKGDFP
ncbi:MAG TPA: hypothetical protein DCY27_04900 [Desulfobacterales bacterium]|nr:hypothetical protein [Desulfobacterales bacterium]